jgi:hypothetical protein
MTNAFARGSAPGRARDASERSGSFKKGHKKLGGRQKGTPNALSPEYRKSVLEAAYRVGMDGNGSGGIVGYCMWIATCYPQVYLLLFARLLELENSDVAGMERPSPTVDDINERLRKSIGLPGSAKASDRPKPELLDELICVANQEPERFFKLIIAMLPRPRRGRGSM